MELTIEAARLSTDSPDPAASGEPTASAESTLAASLQEASQNLARLNDRALAFARERPGTCVLGAVALGFIVGKIAARY